MRASMAEAAPPVAQARASLFAEIAGGDGAAGLRPADERPPPAAPEDEEDDLHGEITARVAERSGSAPAAEADADTIERVSELAAGWRDLPHDDIRALAATVEELRERHSAGGVLDDAQWCDRGAGELGACAALVQQVNEVEGVADRLRALAEPGAKAVPGRLRAATEAAAA
eukprot:COSAG04_NODE_3512_length_2750_cov_1.937005_1_plen_171_part_10